MTISQNLPLLCSFKKISAKLLRVALFVGFQVIGSLRKCALEKESCHRKRIFLINAYRLF